jgi:hypothetical protein
LEEVARVLKTDKITRVVAVPVGDPERVILKELVFKSGIRMHFDSSARGACVYYLEKLGPTCVEEAENVLRVERADERSDSNREEA